MDTDDGDDDDDEDGTCEGGESENDDSVPFSVKQTINIDNCSYNILLSFLLFPLRLKMKKSHPSTRNQASHMQPSPWVSHQLLPQRRF